MRKILIHYFIIFIVSTPTVTVAALNTQIVGQSLMLECNLTAVRGITSRVDIIWRNNDGVMEIIRRVNASSLNNNGTVYSASYTIPLLRTIDDGRVYQCEVVINTSPPVMATNNIILDVAGTKCLII